MHFSHQCKQQKAALENSTTSIYVDFYHDLGWGMYINLILKSRNPRNSNLVRKDRKNDYFSCRTKLEVIRYHSTYHLQRRGDLGSKLTNCNFRSTPHWKIEQYELICFIKLWIICTKKRKSNTRQTQKVSDDPFSNVNFVSFRWS